MSKTKGNVIDPLEVIDRHGADPLRFTLLAMAGQGRDIKLSVDRVEGYRAFCNKLWNAVKFLHLQFEPEQGGPVARPVEGCQAWLKKHWPELSVADRWILSRLEETRTQVLAGLERFELNESAHALYSFVWHELCDWYIELSKQPLREGGADRIETLVTLHTVLEGTLNLMHPLMPFVTEELWKSLPWRTVVSDEHQHATRKTLGLPAVESLMMQPYLRAMPEFRDREATATIQAIQKVVDAIRNFRGENNLSPKVEFPVRVVAASGHGEVFLKAYASELKALTRVTEFVPVTRAALAAEAGALESVIPISNPDLELRIALKGLVNVEEETKRLRKEIEKVNADLAHVRGKLARESFVSKAPKELVEAERAHERAYLAKLSELEAALERVARLS
jgi:valyl-tRNA synthetase